MQLLDLLKTMIEREASDMYFTTGAPVSLKVHGSLIPVDDHPLTNGEAMAVAEQVMNEVQMKEFLSTNEMNLAISETGVGRFRVNVFQQRGEVALVIRHIKSEIPKPEHLLLPPVLKDIMMEKSGLFLLVGATGSGKSTTMASLLDYRNEHAGGHIVTIEDPIEYTHNHKNALINQREVGVDTDSFEIALRNSQRQAPDVIYIGEIRTPEAMQFALEFAETGHLCISTLHASSATHAIDRIINFFPPNRHAQVYHDLGMHMKSIVSQRLIPSLDNKRVAAFEVMINSALISDLILRRDLKELKEVIEKSEQAGMCSFDQSIYQLFTQGLITEEHCLQYADSKNNMRIKIALNEGSGLETDKLSLASKAPTHVLRQQYQDKLN